jgi:Domain of unknown function (DUF4349)
MQSPELILELRAARPVASIGLRQRVLAVATHEQPRRRRPAFPPLRRLALVAVPAALAIAIGGAVVHGLLNPSASPPQTAVSGGRQRVVPGAVPAKPGLPEDLRHNFTTIPTTPARLQQYGAALRVQLKNRDELSDATKRAMRVARLLGGYVASARYSAPRDGEGSAAIVVRVPVDRVQDAIEEYSDLGTLLAQKVQITDVTKAVLEQAKEIARLHADIARLERGGVSAGERARYYAEKARLDYLTKRRAVTIRRADLARISLALTTKPKHAATPASRFHRTMSDAGHVLVREAEILLYALIVAGPLLLLGGAAVGAARLAQRRRDSHLLDRA